MSTQFDIVCLDLMDPPPTDGCLESLADRVAQVVNERQGSVTLVAHGLGVPIARHAVQNCSPARLVLSNGPITRLDPFTHTLCRTAGLPGGPALLQTEPFTWWLSSSLGLRRAVRNPYVMDHDTVVAITGPHLQGKPQRRTVAQFLSSLRHAPPPRGLYEGPTLAAWGDEDPLYPLSEADNAQLWCPEISLVRLPGGHFMHPLEQPWALADAILEWTEKS
ncbi:MAG: alpha/beta hydrolase [Myxococcota bacterium]|nr:alpha/beta hydrolase [Myxococcota bacterium]